MYSFVGQASYFEMYSRLIGEPVQSFERGGYVVASFGSSNEPGCYIESHSERCKFRLWNPYEGGIYIFLI